MIFNNRRDMEDVFFEEKEYLKAKKKVKEIKAFYIHLAVFLINTPIIIAVNLIFSPSFHWFWFSVLGWGLGLGIHGLVVFSDKFFGKDWEEKKIKELMNNTKT